MEKGMKKKRLLVAAIIVGAFASALFYLYVSQKEAERRELEGKRLPVVVAATDIPAGTQLTKNHIDYREVPEMYLPPNPIFDREASTYIGATVSTNIRTGDMILSSDFARADRKQTLSTRVPPDERAYTMPVSKTTGLAGLVKPGDRVDVIYTVPLNTESESITEGQRTVSGFVTLTLLQNVTVLASGSQLAQGQQNKEPRGGYDTLTLSVTPTEVELLTIAQTRGTISYSLRNREDYDHVKLSKTSLKKTLEEDLEVIQEKRQRRTRRPTRPKPKTEDKVKIERQDED